RGDVGMVEPGKRRRLGLKVLHELAVTELRIQHFDRDFAIERLVDRLVHNSQGAPAELLDESVFTDGFSDHAALGSFPLRKEKLYAATERPVNASERAVALS